MKNICVFKGGALSALMVLLFVSMDALVKAQVVLSDTSYTQTFDSLASGLPTGWRVATGATATSLGTAGTTAPAVGGWSDTTGAFKNFASADDTSLTSSSSTSAQAASTNRALGIRQASSLDAGVAFEFNFSSSNLTISSLSLDLLMLSVQARSTTWTIDYGIGSSPTTFTSLGTYSDPGVFGATTLTINTGLSLLSDQSSVWIRVVALTASTGSGSRDSFGIDNFTLNYSASGSLVSIGAGNTFTPSSFGGAAITSADTAVFDGSAQTVTLNGAVAVGGVKFSTTGYTLAGSASDSLAVSGSITVDDAVSSTISGKITGTNGLTKAGNGTLALTGTNDYTGTTNISAGRLVIGSDDALGAAANGISLGGTLATTGDLTLGAGRTISGSGGLDAAAGSTLTIAGNVSAGSITLSGLGNTVFGGSSSAVTGLAFTNATSLTVTTGTLSLVGSLSANASSGTTSILGAVNFGTTADQTVTVASGGTLAITGPVVIGLSRHLIKAGGGTLDLTASSDTSGLNAVRMGSQGAAPVEAGTLIVGTGTVLGASASTNAFQFNAGTVQATSAVSSVASVSVGGRDNNGVSTPTFVGSATIFGGNLSFYRATGTTGNNRLTVNNATTFNGGWTATTGTGASTGTLIDGTGTLNINGGALIDQATQIGGTLVTTFTPGSGATLAITKASLSGTGGGVVNALIGSGATLQLSPESTASFNTLTLAAGSSLAVVAASGGATTFTGSLISVLTSLSLTGTGVITVDVGASTQLDAGTYTLLSLTGGLLSNPNSDTFVLGTNATGLGYSLTFDNNDLKLVASAIPEPAAWAALLGAAALLGCIVVRRRSSGVC